ncbi:hypothetical protein HGM15179_021136, partial [Zosterops borbonicus]
DKRDMEVLEQVQWRRKVMNGVKYLFCEQRLWELGLFVLEKKQVRGHHINDYKYLNGKVPCGGSRLFSMLPSTKTRDNGQKMMQRKFHLNMRQELFCVKDCAMKQEIYGLLVFSYQALIIGRSSTLVTGLFVLPGVIDSDTAGEIKIMAWICQLPYVVPA